MSLQTPALQQAIASRLQAIARTCLHLWLEPGEAANADKPASTLGGQPWWPTGEAWPRCAGCHQPLAFVGQMRLDGGGHWRPDKYDLLSLFFCWACHQREETLTIERPSGESCLIRLTRLAEQSLVPMRPQEAVANQRQLLPCRLQGKPRLDAPVWQDVADEFAAIAPQSLDDLRACYRQAVVELVQRSDSAPQSQLGGYPHWLAESAWPECRWCGGQMYLLAQLVAEERARLEWGTGRCAYVFCCEEPCDPEALTLVLQGPPRAKGRHD